MKWGKSALDLTGCYKSKADLTHSDLRSYYICRQHIRGKLNSSKICLNGHGQRFNNESLGKTGQSFEQYMPTCEKPNKQSLDKMVLADYDLCHLASKGLKPLVLVERSPHLMYRQIY